ncbi:branched-chain amino acid ABC transporter permease [Candidatus Bathyarchaeota archaeon]|nr:MAG: branched-chain amino acid ABC transporter permease [Candidatus Bathyarchaeota archaeon]
MVIFIGIYSIVSISLNLEYGFTGLANFGKVAFFMVGAYSSAILANFGYPYIVCILVAAAMAGLAGFLVSIPALRLRADYLAIVTLAFGEILRFIFKNEDWIAGGVQGITVPSAFQLTGIPIRFSMLIQIGIVYLSLALCYLLVQLIVNSPYGRTLKAIREDELAVQALGKNTFNYKTQVFSLSSAMTGLAGSLFAQYVRFIDPYTFEPFLTFSVWMMVILGGPANNLGAILGAGVVTSLERGARIIKDYILLPVDPHNLRIMLIGTLIILILMYKPEGLLKESKIKTSALEVSKKWRRRRS